MVHERAVDVRVHVPPPGAHRVNNLIDAKRGGPRDVPAGDAPILEAKQNSAKCESPPNFGATRRLDGDVGADVRVRRAPGVALDALSCGVHRAQVRRRQRRAH